MVTKFKADFTWIVATSIMERLRKYFHEWGAFGPNISGNNIVIHFTLNKQICPYLFLNYLLYFDNRINTVQCLRGISFGKKTCWNLTIT